jgi:hypothetical protein
LACLPVRLARLPVHFSSENLCFSMFSPNSGFLPIRLCYLPSSIIHLPNSPPQQEREKGKKKPKYVKPVIDAPFNLAQ